MRRWLLTVCALAAACQCGTRAGELTYACEADDDCAEGFRCGAGATCVAEGATAGGGAPTAGGGAPTAGGGAPTAGGGAPTAGGGAPTAGGGAPTAGGGAPTAGGGAPTAGGGAPTAGGACATFVSTVGPAQTQVRATVLEAAGRPRALWVTTAAALYSECTAGCSSATPTWSSPATIGGGVVGRDTRPLLRELGGVSSAMWRTGSQVQYAECAANCTAPASWSTPLNIAPAMSSGRTLGYDVVAGLRAAAFEDGAVAAADGGGFAYAECTGNCSASSALWRLLLYLPINPSGADVRLTPLADGGTRRVAAIFADDSNVIRYGECEAGCLQADGWSFISLAGDARDPSLVFDAQGLPRIFARNATTDRLFVYRCAQRPCTTFGNWASTNLLSSGHVTGGNFADGGTFFVTSTPDGGQLLLGVEGPAATYTSSPLTLCSGAAVPGERPHAYAGANGQLRLVYVSPPGSTPVINFLYQGP
ncbi:MAG: hypothetical protein JNK82_31755 [Myxococcaceae bacterium]|nr:hypothetical protein [Myxococcaceae bacterium]